MDNRRSMGLGAMLWLSLGAGASAQDAQNAAVPATIKLYTKDVQVAPDGSSTETLHVEIQAGSDAAVAAVSQNAIPFDATMQEITVVEAHTLKSDGKTVPVDAGAIYEQLPSGQQAQMLSSQRAKVIVFPQFAAGDTAVYTVKIATKHPFFENQFSFGDAFARTVAYAEVRETVTAPKSLPLRAENHEVEFSKKDNGADVIYSWHYSAPKPTADETPAISPLDHTPRFFLSSFKDYAELGRTYAALTNEKLAVTPKVRALADEITSGVSDRRTQAQKLYEWVSGHIRYVAIELGKGSFVPHDVDVILANGYGDCKDHDLLLQALLKAKGIDAQSILINGGNNSYSLTEVPTFFTLDHVITFAPDLNLYMDSSAGIASFGVLPMQEYGKPMVIASASSAALGKMPLLPPGLAKITVKTVDTLDKDGQLSGTTTTTATGPYAIVLRSIGLAIQAVGPNAANRVMATLGYRDATGSFTQDSPVALGPGYTITGSFKTSGWKEQASGSTSFLMPGGLRLFSLSGDGIMGPYYPGKTGTKDPTLCFSAEAVEDLSLKAPPGVQFEAVPKDLRVETPNLLFTAHWSLDGDTLSVHRDFTSHIDQQFCSGAVREKTAAALQQIIDSYDHTDISFKKSGAAAKPGDADLDKGVADHMAGKYDLAVQDYDKAIAAQPDNALAYSNRGLAHDAAGHYDLAIADFDKALSLKPDDAATYFSRGGAHYKAGQYTSAIADYDKTASLKPGDAAAYFWRGRAHDEAGQYAPAIADYDSALALKPDDAATYYSRGRAHDEAGQYALGVPDLDKALALKPDDADAFVERGHAYQNLKQNERALADFDRATTLKPDNPTPYYDRGILYANTQKLDRAITELTQAIKLKPDLHSYYYARGEAYYRSKQYTQAIADYDQAIKLKPDEAGLYYDRAAAYLNAGQPARALEDCNKLVALKPNLAEAFELRAMVKHALGQKYDADADKAVKLDPKLMK